MSTEDRELSLVGKVEMRIALAEDDKLQNVLTTYLPPLLLKLASDHLSVRNKVISTCQHIKIRLGGNESVVLPVAALLKQYKEHPNHVMIRHFDLLFIQQSIGKLSSSDQLDLLPVLIHGLGNDAGKPGCATIFNLFLRLLPRLRLPLRGTKEDTDLRSKLGLDEHSADASFVSLWFSKLILLTVVRRTPGTASSNVGCPGLTEEEYLFLTLNGKSEAWDPASTEGLNLAETKVKVLSFLSSGAFTDEERFDAALFATADANSRISDLGDDMLKRTSLEMEDPPLIERLFGVYQKSRPSLQTRILTLLSKSVAATKFPRQIIEIVQKGVTPNHPMIAEVKGLEAKRLRNGIFNFMNWISRMGSQDDLQQIAPQVISYLRDFIESQGWPVPNDRSVDEAAMRALAYETLGSMARAVPSMVREPNLSLVRWLFQSLTEEKSADSITISIQGALASVLNAFSPPLEAEILKQLRLLLLKYISQEEDEAVVRSARFATVRWANKCLEYADTVARWIDILALGGRPDERSDVVEEGMKGLDPYWYRLGTSSDAPPFKLPKWEELVKVFFTSESLLAESHEANTMKTGMEVDGVSVLGNFSGQKVTAFPHAVNYCRRMLLFGALETNEVTDADWERQLDVLLRTDLPSRDKLKTHMESFQSSTLAIWLSAAFEGMLWNEGNGLSDCGKTFVEFGALAASETFDDLAMRYEELLVAVKSNTPATRAYAAQAFGMLAPHPSNSILKLTTTVESLLTASELWKSAVGAEANKVHGAIMALGYVLSRAVYYGRSGDLDGNLIQQAIDRCFSILADTKDASIRDAALISIAQMATVNLVTAQRLEGSVQTLTALIDSLAQQGKKGNEKAITALGRLSMAATDPVEGSEDDSVSRILKELFSFHELKQSEVHFTIGEAIACVAGRWQSESLHLAMDVDSQYQGDPQRSTVLKTTMNKLLQDCKTTKPSLKKASGIWLFCLVQHCGQLDEIQSRLRECQAAFMGLLSARDDLVQETASRGLSLVYERGDGALRERLVADLVASFTGTTTKIKVDDDTELFEPGALPTAEGESITSYKDIMSLAAEVGDQSLVYKFMGLASNAATWSTRAAFGRFGLSSILSESAVDPKIYPKLYRYRFDPNKNVQRSMNDIWTALVKNSTSVINDHFDAIMDDLLNNILGKEWRTRQASCTAIADLVQGRQFDTYEKYLSQIWDVSFKVLDDIKGSVREAAASLCKVLTTILVRQLEQGTSSKNAQAMLDQVIPFLFSTRGLESASEDVKGFAYRTVLKIVKSAGKTLLPYIPTMVEQILGLLSTLEPEAINYIQMNAAKYNTTAEEIDSMRSQAVSHSPLMESVERCLDLLDNDTTAKLVPGLQNVVKTAIGMPSKIGCSGILISLATRHSFQFRPHADVFLKDIEKAVLDRNSTVSASYARSAGYISRLASDASVLRLTTYAKKLYFEAEDETRRQVSAEIVYSISKFATDRFNSLASELLPFVFLAKHDYDEHVKDQFQKTWDENVGGSRAILLYLKEIVTISVERLDSPKWAIKHTAALTIADATSSAGTDISLSNATLIWPGLEKALALKTFDGKEKLLEAFVNFAKNGKVLWQNNADIAAQTKKIALREARRNNEAYRPHGFSSLGEYSEARDDIDMFDEVYDVVGLHLEELIDDDRMDTTDDKAAASSKEVVTITAGLSALFLSINTKRQDSSAMAYMTKLATLLKPVLTSSKSNIATRTAYYERSNALFKGLGGRTHTTDENRYALAWEYFELLDIHTGAGTESVRLIKAEAAGSIALSISSGFFGMPSDARDEVKTKMSRGISEAREHERSPQVKEMLDKATRNLSG